MKKYSLRESFCVVLVMALLCCAAGAAKAQTIQGDLDGDGFVGALDIQIILNNWNQLVPVGDLSHGDLLPDGYVDLSDLTFLLLNWGQGTIPTPGGDASLGINLNELTYYTRELAFVDAVKSARPWVSTNPSGQPFDTGQTVNTDANGWPILQSGQAAQTLMLVDKPGAYPTGTYTVTFDGDGELDFEFDASNVQLVSTGRMTFQVNSASSSGILMRISRSNPSDHVRNIKVWMPGYEGATSSFHDLFIQRLQPFGVIRFMDWQHTNGSKLVSWSDRTEPDDFSMDTTNGVALEYMIELCNELGADAWFCMPHQADDNFVTQFATMVRDNLDPELKVYIEWSNEVWNSQFSQSKWVNQQSGSNIFSDAWFQTMAGHVANDFGIWQNVFAGQTDRLFRVAAGQQANVWVTRRLTQELDNLGSPYDAISCAAYFDHWNAKFDASTTVQDILDNAINHTIPDIYTGFYQDHGDLSQELTNRLGRNIPLLAYEGGQHYTVHGNSAAPYYQAFKDVQEADGMYDAYTANMEAFDQAGGSLFMAYNYIRKQDQYGSWGHLQYQNQDPNTSPKYRALLDFNSE